MSNVSLKSLVFPGLDPTYTVPQKTSDLTNDSGFITENDIAAGLNEKAGILRDTFSGGIALFTPDATVENLLGLTVAVEPLQAGSGDPSPQNVRPISGVNAVTITHTGTNLIGDFNIVDGEGYNSAGVPEINPSRFRTEKIACAGQSKILVAWTIGENVVNAIRVIWDKNGNVLNRTIPSASADGTRRYYITDLSQWPGAFYIAYAFYANGTAHAQDNASDLTCEFADTLQPYVPPTGDTYTIQLGQTVYGGTLDVIAGRLTVDRGYIASYAGETLPGAWISDRDVYAAGTTPTTGAQVVYELATLTEITLTGQEIQTVPGTVNYVWADAGEVGVDYAADLKAAIEAKIPAPSSPSTGAFLVWDGSAWVAQTLSTWQGGSY